MNDYAFYMINSINSVDVLNISLVSISFLMIINLIGYCEFYNNIDYRVKK